MIICENKNYLIYEKIDALINQGALKDRNIVLFGLNTSSYVTKKYLEKKGYRVFAYIDNDQKKILETREMLYDKLPRHFSGDSVDKQSLIMAYKPEELLADFRDDAVVLIASKYYPSMKNQLEKMSYVEDKHFFRTLDFYGIDDIIADDDTISGLTELSTEEVRRIQMDITLYVDELCKKNGLNYYMTGGTLLGAVRHKGYIPWDDDVDITIPVSDYKKLIELIKEDDKYDMFSVYSYDIECPFFYGRIVDRNTTMKLWEYPILTTSGVSIDVFPLIGMPERVDERMQFFNRIRHLNTKYMNSFIEFEECKEIWQERKVLREQVITMMEQCDFYTSEYAGYILSKYWEKDIMPRSIYDEKIDMAFEDICLPAPKGYEDYLGRIFGDYMKLPSEKEQYVTHNYKVYRN